MDRLCAMLVGFCCCACACAQLLCLRSMAGSQLPLLCPRSALHNIPSRHMQRPYLASGSPEDSIESLQKRPEASDASTGLVSVDTTEKSSSQPTIAVAPSSSSPTVSKLKQLYPTSQDSVAEKQTEESESNMTERETQQVQLMALAPQARPSLVHQTLHHTPENPTGVL
jgi:hypothetical protein